MHDDPNTIHDRASASVRPARAPRALLLILAALLGACSSGGVPPRDVLSMRDVQFAMRDMRFPSGLRVVVEKDDRAPLAGVFVIVGAGSSSDPQGKEGLAHFVEHLTFRSRPNGKATFLRQLERAEAGAWNAFTGPDYTAYFEIGPASALPELLRLEGIRLLAPVAGVTPEALTVEREVVRNELRQRGETGFIGEVLGSMQAALFPAGHPYARPVVGTHAGLSAITPEDIDGFLRSHYRPENMTMVIVGDVDLQAIGRVVETSLPARLLAAPSPVKVGRRMPERAPEPPAPPPAQLERKEATVATPELWIGWSLPRSFDAEAHLGEFIQQAADEELSRASLVDQDIAAVSTRLIQGKEAAMLLCRVHLHEASHPERSMTHVIDQAHRIWTLAEGANAQNAGDARFSYRKRTAVVGMVLDAENVLNRGLRRAELIHFAQDPTLFSRSLRQIGALDRTRMIDYAEKYLARGRARGVLFMPAQGSGGEPLGATGVGTFALDEEDGVPPAVDAARIRSVARPPAVGTYRSLTLPNGLEVVIGRRAGLPVVTAGLLLHGGESTARSPAAARVAWILASPIEKWHGEPEEFGGRFGRRFDRDAIHYTIQGAAGNVGIMLGVLSERVRSMDVDSGRLPAFAREFVPFLRIAEQRPETVADRAFWKQLYGGHAYAQKASSDELASVSGGDAQGWIDATHGPSNAVLAVVGEIDTEQVAGMVLDQFGSWKDSRAERSQALPPVLSSAAAAAPLMLVTHRPGATQGQIRFGCQVPGGTAWSGPRYDLAARIVDDHLTTIMREKLGATYGIHAFAEALWGGSAHLRVGGDVESTKLGQALGALRDALASLADKPIEERALAWAKLRVAQGYGVAHLTNEEMVEALLEARNTGRTIASIDEYPADLVKVSAEDVRDTFRRCAAGRPTLSIVGDEPSVRAAIKETWP